MSSSNSKMSTYSIPVIISNSWDYYGFLKQIFLVAVRQDLCFSPTAFIRKKDHQSRHDFLQEPEVSHTPTKLYAILMFPEKKSCNSYELYTIPTCIIHARCHFSYNSYTTLHYRHRRKCQVFYGHFFFTDIRIHGFRKWRLSNRMNKIYQNVPRVLRKPDTRNSSVLSPAE